MSTQRASASLAEGASRFDRLIRDVKDGQKRETEKVAPGPATVLPAFVPSPDEVWARQFMTLGIGPTADFKTPLQPSDKPAAVQPEVKIETPAPTPASGGGSYAPKLPGASGADRIGAVLGREPPKRSWLGRLFRGR